MIRLNDLILATLLLVSFGLGIWQPIQLREFSLFNAFWSAVFILSLFIIFKKITNGNN